MDTTKNLIKNIKLKNYNDIFSLNDDLTDNQSVQFINLEKLVNFKNHPFKVIDNDKMTELLESILDHGILTPLIVRPLNNDQYEIISGHRRKYCANKAGLIKVPVIIKDKGDDESALLMIDSNIQRENILPSEKAYIYKMKMDIIRRQGERTDLTSRQVDAKWNSALEVGKMFKDSDRQVQRYVRLTMIIPFLQDAGDNNKISFNGCVELSYLDENEQFTLTEIIKQTQIYPSLDQCKNLRMNSGKLTKESIINILGDNKKKDRINMNLIRSFFPKHYTTLQIEDEIIKILKQQQNSPM